MRKRKCIIYYVRSKPLGKKRKRGRPTKVGHCWVRSPQQVSEVPVAHYHHPSPEIISLENLDIENIPIIANLEIVRAPAPAKRAKRALSTVFAGGGGGGG